VAAGVLVWQFVLRPVEERDLAARFGAAYEAYRRAVRCWWPRLTPFRAD
jgi:protein-S-isoprenylcysteine O-methyltransferase Ste14